MTRSLPEEGSSKECAASAPGSSTDSATLSLGDRQGGVADGAARTGVQAEDARGAWQADLGVSLSRRWSRLGAATGGRVRDSGRGAAGAAGRARAAAAA